MRGLFALGLRVSAERRDGGGGCRLRSSSELCPALVPLACGRVLATGRDLVKHPVDFDTDHPGIGDDHPPLLSSEAMLIGGAKEPLDPAKAATGAFRLAPDPHVGRNLRS